MAKLFAVSPGIKCQLVLSCFCFSGMRTIQFGCFVDIYLKRVVPGGLFYGGIDEVKLVHAS
jgi:hypothetical protein